MAIRFTKPSPVVVYEALTTRIIDFYPEFLLLLPPF
jgi:hypothetical protein